MAAFRLVFKRNKKRPLSDDLTAAFHSVYRRRKKNRPLSHDLMAAFQSVYKRNKKRPLSDDLTAAFHLRTRCVAALELRPIFQSIENTV